MGYEVFHAIPVNERIPRFTVEEPEYQFRELRTVTMENRYFRVEVDSYTGVIKKLTLLSTGENIFDPDKPWGAMLVKEPDTGDFWELYSPLRGGMNSLFNRSLPPEGIPGAVYSKDAGGSCSNDIYKYCDVTVKQTFSIWRQNFGSSSFKLTMTMYDDMPRIDFSGAIDNMEPDVRYRAVFPTAVEGGRIIRGTPFGFAETPEGEYPAIDFVDYSDGGTGVSLLNTGNPGNMVFGGTMAISLLKAAAYKFYAGGGYDGAGSSTGGYEIGKSIPFAFSIYPHEGPCDPAKAARQGREFNMPVSAVKCEPRRGGLPARHSFLSVDCDSAIITCFKPAPARGRPYVAGGGGYVLRLYEAGGIPYENVTVSLDFLPGGVVAVDLTEKPLDVNDAVISGGGFTFPLKANEVRTFIIYK
jgi:alpha-mannosidase